MWHKPKVNLGTNTVGQWSSNPVFNAGKYTSTIEPYPLRRINLILKRVLLLIIILPFVFICAAPIIFIGFVIGEPAIGGWLTERSIIVMEGATYTFSNDMQFSGSYKQRSLYYWSPKNYLK